MAKEITPQLIVIPEENDQEYPITLLQDQIIAPTDSIIAYQDPTKGNQIYILQTYGGMGNEFVNVWVNAHNPTDYRAAGNNLVRVITDAVNNPHGIDICRFNNLQDCLEYFKPATETEQVRAYPEQSITSKAQSTFKLNLHQALGAILQESVKVSGMQRHINDLQVKMDEAIDMLWMEWGLNSDEEDDEVHIQDRLYWDIVNGITERLGKVLKDRKVSSLIVEIFENTEVADIITEVLTSEARSLLSKRFGNVNTERFDQ